MARTVNPDEYASRRAEILDTAQRLVLTRGYGQISVQDILEEMNISSGAFHHYFNSRDALLEAFIERMRQESEKPLLPIIHDPNLTALEKLQAFFDSLDQLSTSLQPGVVSLIRTWYTDGNALVRQRVDEAVFNQRKPLMDEIIRQGMNEGIFSSAHPEKTGEVILWLWRGAENSHARLLLRAGADGGDRDVVDEVLAVHASYMEAVERVLGLAENSLRRISVEKVNTWLEALRANDPAPGA